VLAATSPALLDLIVAENENFIAVLAWLNAAGCQKIVDAEAPLGELAATSKRA
jgi:hypothetical protein